MERKILEMFLYSDTLRFNEIEKGIGARSNKLNYHLQKLVDKGVLFHNGEFYKLSDSSEYLVPYISDKKHVLSVILVHIGDSKKAFLIERKKKPYLGKLGLPGGRMILGESIKDGTKRILKKFGVDGNFLKMNSISLEHLKKNKRIIASYLLLCVSAKADVDLFDIKKNKNKIIKSDYLLIMGCGLDKKINLREIDSLVY